MHNPANDLGVRKLASLNPILSRDEEVALFARLAAGDEGALAPIILANLRLVMKVAYGLRHYGLPVDDMIGEGIIGLVKAARKFRLDHSVRFMTYALYWVRAFVSQFVIREWSLVKVGTSRAQRTLFFKGRAIVNELATVSDEEYERCLQELAARHGVRPKDVVDMATRMLRDVSADWASANGSGEPTARLEEVRQLPSDPETSFIREESAKYADTAVATGLAALDERSRLIIRRRHLVDDEELMTLDELSRILDISRERVRQIEKKALKQMREAIEDAEEGIE